MKRAMKIPLLAALGLMALLQAAQASIARESALVGKIVSFDEKTVRVKSGKKVVTFEKSRLKFPSYKVGETIKVEMTVEELKTLPSSQDRGKGQ